MFENIDFEKQKIALLIISRSKHHDEYRALKIEESLS
jgi:hypothetical protein